MEMPSVGRIVHFLDREELIAASDRGRTIPEFYPAVITRVFARADNPKEIDTRVCLVVFHPEYGGQVKLDIEQGEQANQWRWPPRVGPVPVEITGAVSPIHSPSNGSAIDALIAASKKAEVLV
jgi:hypothetical protein